MPTRPPFQRTVIPVERLVADLWEEQRQDLQRQLAGAVKDDLLRTTFPPWEELSDDERREKVNTIVTDLLQPLDRAGYEVRKKPQ